MKLPSLSQIWRRVPRKDLCYTLFLSPISALIIILICSLLSVWVSAQLEFYDFQENSLSVFAVIGLDLPIAIYVLTLLPRLLSRLIFLISYFPFRPWNFMFIINQIFSFCFSTHYFITSSLIFKYDTLHDLIGKVLWKLLTKCLISYKPDAWGPSYFNSKF